MASLPTTFSQNAEVLKPGLSGIVDDALNELSAKGFSVLVGLTRDGANQVLKLANQPHIIEYCPRDRSDERFASEQSTASWLSGGRAVFLLAKKDSEEIVGYGWMGAKTTSEVPGGQSTFAVRLGEAALGQRLSVPFSQTVVFGGESLYDLKNIWLETWKSNGGAVHAYEKLGFKLVHQKPDKRPTMDGQQVDDTRLFMRLR